MIRVTRLFFLCGLLLVAATACSDSTFLQAPASAAFAPTPYEPTLGATPAGLGTATPTPAPSNTPAPTQTPTSAPTSAGPTQAPTNTPTFTPTVSAQAVTIKASDSSLQPNQVSLKTGTYYQLFVHNMGSQELEFQVQNLKLDTLVADESLAGPVTQDQLGTADDDAGNGMIHLFAMPQGAAAAAFTPSQAGNYPFTIKIGNRTLNGSIVIQ